MTSGTTTDQKLTTLLADNGIKHAAAAVQASKQTGLPLAVAAAMLQMESSGKNEFGHDPTDAIPQGWQGGAVTEERYDAYRAQVAKGATPQGVGPTQLTSVGLQQDADKRGGAWVPLHNMQTGFTYLKGLVSDSGGNVQLGLQNYNGSGPAAVAYGVKAAGLVKVWQDRINAIL